MSKERKKLGELLIEAGLIDELQLKSALSYQMEWGGRLGSAIIRKGFVSEQDMMTALEKQLGMSCTSVDQLGKPSDDVLAMIRPDIAKKYGIFPIRFQKNILMIATSDPTDLKTLDEISFMIGFRIKPLLALESDILRAISIYYEGNVGPGRTFRIDRGKLTEKITRTMHYAPPPDHVQTPLEENDSRTSIPLQKREVSQKLVIESIVDLLISKGIITKEELLRQIRAKQQL